MFWGSCPMCFPATATLACVALLISRKIWSWGVFDVGLVIEFYWAAEKNRISFGHLFLREIKQWSLTRNVFFHMKESIF